MAVARPRSASVPDGSRGPSWAALVLALVSSLGCAPLALDVVFASEVVAAPGTTADDVAELARATNGVRGAGESMGSTDVYSLDYVERSSITLGFGGRRVTNGPGVDLVVFENAFRVADSTAVFMDLLVVSVSDDGETWVDFPHDYVAADETTYSRSPSDWPGFAGRTPVLLHAEGNAVDPFDATLAGGDGFDLDVLPTDGAAGRIRAGGVRYVRLTTAPSLGNPDTGAPYVRDAVSTGADIDGVAARWLE